MRRLREITKKTPRTIAPLMLIATGLATFVWKSTPQEAAVTEVPTGSLIAEKVVRS
jgi:hypothetical protein